jgi:hypothetical protein
VAEIRNRTAELSVLAQQLGQILYQENGQGEGAQRPDGEGVVDGEYKVD